MVSEHPGTSRDELLAKVAPTVFLLLWSSGFGIAKVGLRHAGPLTFLTLRYGLIVLVLVPIFAIIRPSLPDRASTWFHIAVVGFLIQFVYFGLAYIGMSLGVSAGVTAVITSTQPLIVGLASPWFTGERIGVRRWTGLLLGATGAITVVIASTSFHASLSAGVVLCIASTLGMAGGTLYQKRFSTAAHPVTVNLIHYLIGLVAMAPTAWAFEPMHVEWTPDFIAALTWIALANSLVAISLLLLLIRRSEASRVSSLFFLVPPMAALFGWVLLGERLSPASWIGMAVAIAGVRLVSRSA